MRILYVVDGRIPTEKANGYQSAQMCQAFIEQGHEVILVHPSRHAVEREGLTSSTTITHYYNLRHDIPLRRLFCIDGIYLMQILLRFGDYNLLSKIGGLTTTFTFFMALGFHLQRQSFDLVYVRSIHGFSLLTTLWPKLARKVCFELHDLPNGPLLAGWFYQRLRLAASVITVTGKLKESLVKNGIKEDKILVAHDAVDLQSFDLEISREEARDKLSLPRHALIASFVGKFHTNGMEKGIPEIIAASALLFREFPELRFYFVGGPMAKVPNYLGLIRISGTPETRFVFLDKQPVETVPLYLKSSDVLLMPHPRNKFYENHVSPLKMFEYMSSGRPIVASALPAIEEVLVHGKNAYLSEAGNPAGIAESIRFILLHPDEARQVAAQAFGDVQEYTWKVRAQSVLSHHFRQLEPVMGGIPPRVP